MEFISNYPWYYTLLCFVAGFVFSALLYVRDKQNAERSTILLYSLATLRFASISIIALLLLDVFMKRLVNETEKPVIILAQDNSSSLVAGKDSSEIKTEYTKALTSFVNSVKDKYDVNRYYDVKEQDVELTSIIAYLYTAPTYVSMNDRFKPEHRSYYTTLTSRFKFEKYFIAEDGTHYFYIISVI